MKLKKSVKISLIILFSIIVLGLLGYGGYKIYKNHDSKKDNDEVEIKENNKKYGYNLKKNMPKYYEELYYALDKKLNKDEVDEEEYAKLVSRMLVFDFYNLNDKMSKNDIGGTQFIYTPYLQNFVLEASETVYKYMEHNVYGNRTQSLPEVSSVEVTNLRTSTYTYNDIKDDKVYVVTVKITYTKDLGYPNEVEVKLLHNDIKLEAFYMK